MKKIFTILGVVSVSVFMYAQTNLVQNPGFESDLAPWAAGTGATYTAPTISTANPHSGLKLAVYENPTATTGFFQNVAIAPSTQYTVSFWYKASTTRPAGATQNNIFRLWSIMKDGTGTPVYTTATAAEDPLRSNNGYLPIAPDTWTQHTVTFTSHASAASIEVAFRAYGSGSSYVDDVVLVQGLLATVDASKDKFSLVKNTVVKETIVFAKNADVQIVNATGQVVKSAKVTNGTSLDVSSLEKGIYIVTGSVNGQKVSQKIIKN
jgi:hypothetical protein